MRRIPIWVQVATGIAIGVPLVIGAAAWLGGDDTVPVQIRERRAADSEATTSTTEPHVTSTPPEPDPVSVPSTDTGTVEPVPPKPKPIEEKVNELDQRVTNLEDEPPAQAPAEATTTTTSPPPPPPPPMKDKNQGDPPQG